jgi:hypothetical protein
MGALRGDVFESIITSEGGAMQQLVSATIGGKTADHKPELMLHLGNDWVPVWKVHEPPFRLRIVQLFQTGQGWFALVEELDQE